jgi:hypothetical protein
MIFSVVVRPLPGPRAKREFHSPGCLFCFLLPRKKILFFTTNYQFDINLLRFSAVTLVFSSSISFYWLRVRRKKFHVTMSKQLIDSTMLQTKWHTLWQWSWHSQHKSKYHPKLASCTDFRQLYLRLWLSAYCPARRTILVHDKHQNFRALECRTMNHVPFYHNALSISAMCWSNHRC